VGGLRFVALAAGSLALQVTLGLHLRAVMAGEMAPWGHVGNLRRAHSHLGYYGILFPLAWWAWSRAGRPAPGPRTMACYAAATLAGTLGFADAGYSGVAIAASTAVLGVWLASAWGQRSTLRGVLSRSHHSWWAPAIPAVVLSAIAIPAVAATLRRAPMLSADLVQGFLTVLLFGVAAPAALAQAGAPAPDTRTWTLGTVGVALLLGPAPGMVAGALTMLLAWQLVHVALRMRAAADLRALWAITGLALPPLALGMVAETHAIAIAGLHFVVLGPVMLQLGAPILPVEHGVFRAAWLLGLAPLTLGVLLPAGVAGMGGPTFALVGGATLACVALLGLVWRIADGRSG
jgi:hypothetical protein